MAPRRILLSLVTSLLLGGCAVPSHYTAENLDARVIDSQTKEPVSGAVVVAMWTLIGNMEVSRVGILKAEETTTDDMGRFHIPGWGPVPRPSEAVLDVLDPELVILKHGYLLGYASNVNTSTPPYARADASIRTSNWNGRDIELERYQGDQRRYKASFGGFVTLDMLVYNSRDCKWKQLPQTIHAFEAERIYQRTLFGKDYDQEISPLSALLVRPQCQPNDKFLKAYDELR